MKKDRESITMCNERNIEEIYISCCNFYNINIKCASHYK